MKGWVTWVAVGGALALAVVDFANGDYEAMGAKLTMALGALGLGRKIEKNK